ncbi:tetratricopeptide repeat-containing glycosyltransferase family protein [Patescibacteria group bacterium]|nr:tetratricopeptide repeat-containing glycosyltransferase family protein [Patescibacteria group bacterium]
MRPPVDLTALSYASKAERAANAKNYDNAQYLFGQSLKTDNRVWSAWANMATVALDQSQFVKAEVCFRRALQLGDCSPEIMCSYADLLCMKGDFAEAKKVLDRADAIAPNNYNVFYSLSFWYQNQDILDKSDYYLRRCIEIRPKHKPIKTALVHNTLMMENFKEGFYLYDLYIDAVENNSVITMPMKRWNGEPLDGKSLYIYCGHGIGDFLQFIRYVAYIPQNCHMVIIDLHPELTHLFASSLATQCSIAYRAYGQPLPNTDYYVNLTSLPHILAKLQGTDLIPLSGAPYLRRMDSTNYLGQRKEGHYRVGIVWNGHTARRWFPGPTIHDFIGPLLSVDNVELYSLQVGPAVGDIRGCGYENLITDCSPLMRSMAECADVMYELDCVVTIDTSIVHLAGAFGIPAHLILRAESPDWRWGRGCDGSLWYDSVTIHRRGYGEPWEKVVSRAAAVIDRTIGPQRSQPVAVSMPIAAASPSIPHSSTEPHP